MNDSSNKNRLYIGNLDYSVTEDDLRRAFIEKDLVAKEVKIITDKFSGRSKGFGFVEVDEGKLKKLHDFVYMIPFLCEAEFPKQYSDINGLVFDRCISEDETFSTLKDSIMFFFNFQYGNLNKKLYCENLLRMKIDQLEGIENDDVINGLAVEEKFYPEISEVMPVY